MANADDFRSLAVEVTDAYKDRVTRIKGIKRETASLRREDQKENKARAADVAKMVDDFDKAHQEMATALRATLAEVKPTLAQNEAERKSQAVAEVKQRAADVAKMVGGFRKEQREAAAAWQELLATMRSTRQAKPLVKEKVPLKVEEVKPPVVAVEKPPALEKQVLTEIKEHPEGLKLAELERATGKARIVLAKVGKKLINQGKVRKEGPLYLPAE